jgi:ribose-phosphate pyrophosphokinase
MLCTHGLFSGDAIRKIENSPIREVIVTNTVAVCSQEVQDSPKVIHMDISQLISESIRRQHYGEWGSFSLEL